MFFSLFFFLIATYLVWAIAFFESDLRYVLIWPLTNSLIMSISYALNDPKLILGKTKEGRISTVLLLINLPWLLLTWCVFKIQQFVSSENFIDKIAGTSLSISSRPPSTFNFEEYDLVIDLTAEFPKDKISTSKYVCFSNLDGASLKNYCEDISILKNKEVLIHCANGHGRSALFTAKILLDTSVVNDLSEGLDLVKSSRPLATPNRFQKRKPIEIEKS